MNPTGDNPILEANLAALAPLLTENDAERLREAHTSDEIEIVGTTSGYPTCRAFGRWTYSRHDPKREAARLIEREVPISTEVCVFQNFGLGYHVEAYLEQFPTSTAIVVEPDIRWFRTALEARDLSPMLSSKRVVFLLDSATGLLQNLLGEVGQTHVVRIRSLARKDADYFARVDEEMRSATARKDINKNTLARFGRRWVRNLIRNVGLIPEARGVQELAGSLAGIPALVLAAGPSLDEALPHLEALRERFALVSVDTSYRAALNAGVVPDFLVVVDPQYWNARHLDGCALDGTILVSESSTYPTVFHRPLDALFFCGSLFPLGQYLERRLGDRGKLGAGGSVSTTTWDLARMLGCAPVACAGLDLGFPANRTHFRGALFEELAHSTSARARPAETTAFHSLRDASPFLVDNNSDGRTLTDRRLIVYKWWFENQLAIHPEAVTLNAASAGIRIGGMRNVSLEELLSYPVRRRDIDAVISEIKQPVRNVAGRRPMDVNLGTAISELIDELSALSTTSRAGLVAVEELDRALSSEEDPGMALAALRTLDERIAAQSSRDIAGFLMHSTAQAILDRPSSERDETEKRRRAVEDSRELYSKLVEAADYHVELLKRAESRLRTS